jgi:hypothetical protein
VTLKNTRPMHEGLGSIPSAKQKQKSKKRAWRGIDNLQLQIFKGKMQSCVTEIIRIEWKSN